MKKSPPNYIIKLIKQFPEILSGRKNYKEHDQRIKKNIALTKNYIQKNKF